MVRLRLILGLALAFAFAAGLGVASSSGGPRSLSDERAAEAQRILSVCRSDPHEGVHDPQRLTILAPCAAVTGTVIKVPRVPPDGDHTFNIAVDGPYANMLNDENRKNGGLHIEIVPKDQPGCTKGQAITTPAGYNNLGVCSGANVAMPALQAKVRVVGPYVHDTWAGPNEIHPAWSVELMPTTTPKTTTQFPPVTTSPGVTSVISKPPTPPPLRARLTGHAVLAHNGAARGGGSLSLRIGAERVCWTFRGVYGIGTATKAWIARGAAGHAGRTLITLGKRYKKRGCVGADPDLFEPVIEQPSRYYAAVASRRRPDGAIRGQLANAS